MSIFFTPNGTLDLTTDPADLPQESGQYSISSGSMQRCKNLRLDESGVAKLRDGSAQQVDTKFNTKIWSIVEQAGEYYSFPGTTIYKNRDSKATGLTNARWSAIKYNSFNSTTQNIFALNGTNRKRISTTGVTEWGSATPTTVPTIQAGASTGLTGDYNAKYTYLRKEGTTVVYESDPSSAAAAAVTLANQSLDVNFAVSSDSQITHTRIYRTEAGGSVYYKDQDIAIPTASVDTTTADTALGTAVATNHDRPPLGTIVIGPNYNGVCFIVKDNLLYYCLAKQPEYWPTDYYIEVSPPHFPGKAAVFWQGQLYYLTQQEIYLVQGTGVNTFFPFPQAAITGTQGSLAVEAVKGRGIFHVGNDGIYLFAQADKKITQGNFERLFRGETVNDVPGIDRTKLSNCWLKQYRSKLYFGYAGTAEDYPSNVLVFDLTTSKAWYYSYPFNISAVEVDETNDRFLAGDTAGIIHWIENKNETTDASTAISWEIESKDFTMQTRAHFPRFVKYDIDASSATSATGKVVLDGTVHQSHTLSEDRKTKKRLVTVGNGDRESLRVTGSGPITIYGIEAE